MVPQRALGRHRQTFGRLGTQANHSRPEQAGLAMERQAMRLPALIFPQTALRGSLFSLLWPLFEPVLVLEPAGLGAPAPVTASSRAGLVEVVRPPADPAAMDAPKAADLGRLIAQWEQWTAQNKGTERAESLKAGLRLPAPDDESFRQLIRDIRGGKRDASRDLAEDLPELAGDLFLRLMHMQDQEAAEMEELLAKVQFGERLLGQAMGLDQEDTPAADYEQPFWQKLSPLDHDLHSGQHLRRRLQAWAGLARRAGHADAWLASADLPAVRSVLEAANRRLRPETLEARSPAGASAPMPDALAGLPPDPDSPQAQEAARLVLPDLGHLTADELLELGSALARQDKLEHLRQGLADLLGRLANETWSARLGKDLAGPARAMADSLAEQVRKAGVTPGPTGRGLSILVFPGLDRDHLLGLMAGGPQADLPARGDWPHNWPAGSGILLAAW